MTIRRHPRRGVSQASKVTSQPCPLLLVFGRLQGLSTFKVLTRSTTVTTADLKNRNFLIKRPKISKTRYLTTTPQLTRAYYGVSSDATLLRYRNFLIKRPKISKTR